MILRQIVRWPGRAAFTVIGVAASVALLIGTLFFLDAPHRVAGSQRSLLAALAGCGPLGIDP